MILQKSSAFKEAPPINPPSTSLQENNSCALSALQLPPYKIETLFARAESYKSLIVFLINACISCACCAVAVSPVPIAQTGSYAIINLENSSVENSFKTTVSCSVITLKWLSVLRS